MCRTYRWLAWGCVAESRGIWCVSVILVQALANHRPINKNYSQKRTMHTGNRPHRRFPGSVDGTNEKVDRLISVIARLEEDVRVQVDRSIRDLEATDLRQQKEIADLND